MSYKIAVLMGGGSLEREFSLESGSHINRVIRERGHDVLPLDTTPTLVETLRSQDVDAVYIALHGKGGEDGTIQAMLEYLQIPYVGSTSAVCRIAWNKANLPHVLNNYRRLRQADQPQPANSPTIPGGPASWPGVVSLAAASLKDMGAVSALDLLEQRIAGGYPLAVKPARSGSAMGVRKVASFAELGEAMLDALSFDTAVLIEKWVEGVELAVTVLEAGDTSKVLPAVEIVPKQGFFNTVTRQDAELVDYYCPVRAASLSPDPAQAKRALQAIEAAALEVHRALGCRDISRVDLIWDGNQPQVLEANLSPGMTEHSLVPMACAAASLDFGQLLEDLLTRAIARQGQLP